MIVSTKIHLVARSINGAVFGNRRRASGCLYGFKGVRVRSGICINTGTVVGCKIAVNRGYVITTNTIMAGSIPPNDIITNIPTEVVNDCSSIGEHHLRCDRDFSCDKNKE